MLKVELWYREMITPPSPSFDETGDHHEEKGGDAVLHSHWTRASAV